VEIGRHGGEGGEEVGKYRNTERQRGGVWAGQAGRMLVREAGRGSQVEKHSRETRS
jgi:hypothetical protein